jgi:hypothetical protein
MPSKSQYADKVQPVSKSSGYPFVLQFDPQEIDRLAERYNYPSDAPVLDGGRRIRSGNFKRADVEAIFDWKTKGRGRSRLKKNSDEEIKDALSLAIQAKTARAAISVLSGLRGIDVPVASAILTAIDPERFTVIDFRALEALGCDSKNRSVDFYLEYLEACCLLSRRHHVGLRKLDRALWQWSKERKAKPARA